MELLLSRLNAGELIALVAIIGGLLCAILGILAGTWEKIRRTELTMALKQDMLNRGMSADDIRAVLEAGSKRASKVSERSA